MTKKMIKVWENRSKKFPTILKKWDKVLINCAQNGIYSVSYPSMQAIHHELGDNYVAIAGDGLFMFMFEILSLEGNGSFRFAENPSWGTEFENSNLYDKRYESQTCKQFREAAGCEYNDVLNGMQIFEALEKCLPPPNFDENSRSMESYFWPQY